MCSSDLAAGEHRGQDLGLTGPELFVPEGLVQHAAEGVEVGPFGGRRDGLGPRHGRSLHHPEPAPRRSTGPDRPPDGRLRGAGLRGPLALGAGLAYKAPADPFDGGSPVDPGPGHPDEP